MYPLDLNRVTPQRERQLRQMWKGEYRSLGRPFPCLAMIGFVELDVLKVPEWAYFKRIKGLTCTDKSIWLRRILARRLYSEDVRAGGNPKLTLTFHRMCKLCKRQLIGPEAQQRWRLDCLPAGWLIPCGPDCKEIEERRKKANRSKTRIR
jgi:hypothetical protein